MEKVTVNYNNLIISPRSILRVDGGKGTIDGHSLGPKDLDDLDKITAVDATSCYVEYHDTSGPLGMGHKRYAFGVKTSGFEADAALTHLLQRLGLDWEERYKYSYNNNGTLVLLAPSRDQGHALAAATIALVALAREVAELPQRSYTIEVKYLGNNTGHKFTQTGEYAGVKMMATYIVPFDTEAYVAERERLARESVEDNTRSKQDLETSENNNEASKLDVETEKNKQATTAGKTFRYVGIAAVTLLVIGAVVYIVKRNKK